MMWTNVQFWKDATWRAFRTFCQTLASLFGGLAFNILTAPWSSVLSIAAGAALISLWQSIDRERAVGATVGGTGGASTPVVTQQPVVVPSPEVVTACGDALQ
jgi:hypothetical protein